MGDAPRETCRVIVLGSTGSIGTQTLSVIEHLNALHGRGEWATRYEVVGLAAGRNVALLDQQAARFRNAQVAIAHIDVRDLAIAEQGMEASFSGRLYSGLHGEDSPLRLVRQVDCDLVVAAMVGSAGLPATLEAVRRGRDIALANKETLVAAGSLVVEAARRSGSWLLPVDSEHSGLWQCLAGVAGVEREERHQGSEASRHQGLSGGGGLVPPAGIGPEVSRVILTASGGPFRTWPRERIAAATPEEALKHPTWKMGPKVTIDSASLMNKGLEVIEAHWLFGLEAERIGVLIHPQSIVHAIVEYADGSAIAQLGSPDMRTPIQYALGWPHRAPGCSPKLHWAELRSLDFEPPDTERFPALGLAYRAIREGGTAGAVLNAANEEAVRAFLGGGGGGRALAFADILRLTEAAMEAIPARPVGALGDVQEADAAARRYVRERLG